MTGTQAGVVIAGTGVAGVTAAQTLRADGFTGPVTLVGAEPGLPYRRTALSKDLLGADLSTGRIQLSKPEYWDANDITVRSGTRIVDVDREQQTVTLDDGDQLPYRALVIATGGQPVRPAWLGADVPTLRTLADAEAIRAAVTESGSLVVIGGGLIGLELAASTAAAGLPTVVLEAGDRLMQRVLPEQVSEFFAGLHRGHGADIRLGARVVSADARQAQLADGSVVTGTVVAALGIVPDTELAVRAGVPADRGGVPVDGALRTEVPGVYAAGDVAVLRDRVTGEPVRSEHWFGAVDQGKAVARTVLADFAGEDAPEFTEVPRAWTIQYGVNTQLVGNPAAPGTVTVEGDLEAADAAVTVGDPLVGAVTVGRPAQARELRGRIGQELAAGPVR